MDRPGDASGLTIEVHPLEVFGGSLVSLTVRGEALHKREGHVRWNTSGGNLYYDDLREVHWRAPARPGSYRIEVAVRSGDETSRAMREVRVETPSTQAMVWIPAGEFLCGDVYGTRNLREVKTVQNDNDEPAHIVDLDGYWIDRYPVTNRKYVEFLEASLAQGMARVEDIAVMGQFEGEWVPFYYFRPYEELIPGYRRTRNARKPRFLHLISWDGQRFEIRKDHETHPVVDVSWFGAAAYANFWGKQLPSEAQWEKAARGTDGRRYPWGDNLPTSYHVNLRGELTPVGTYSPLGDSPYGVADMVSPCHEWTNDWFNADYYTDFAAESPHRNPEGPFWGLSHAIRGSPLALQYLIPTVLRSQPVARRYNWRFEFLLGDSFADRQTTFRTVIAPADGRSGRGGSRPCPDDARDTADSKRADQDDG